MLQTDTIPTPGWWLCGVGERLAFPSSRRIESRGTTNVAEIEGYTVHCYTHDPDAVLAWVRDGVLP